MSARKKKTYAAVLIVAAMALLVDRLLVAGSLAPAAAATDRSLTALGVKTPTEVSALVAATPFPTALPQFSAAGEVRDIFSPTPRVQNILLGLEQWEDPRAGLASSHRKPETAPAKLFEQNHHVTAVMVARQNAVAIVDDAWLKVGDTMDGCELVEITGTNVTFKCAAELASLSAVQKWKVP